MTDRPRIVQPAQMSHRKLVKTNRVPSDDQAGWMAAVPGDTRVTPVPSGADAAARSLVR